MDWMCSTCQIPNRATAEYCSQCQAHWGSVWKRKNRRSKSRKQRDKKDKKAKEQDNKGQAAKDPQQLVSPEDAILISEKLPWIPSTPSARQQTRQVEIKGGTDAPVPLPSQPPPPQLPAPPVGGTMQKEKMSPSDQQLLQHLIGLRELGTELSPDLAGLLQSLEEKSRSQTQMLSHSHVNRLNKLRQQVSAAGRKVSDLDRGWTMFAQSMMDKIQHHSQLYLECRQRYLEAFRGKQAELQAAKDMIQQASQGLHALPELEVKVEPEDVKGAAQVMQQMLTVMPEQSEVLMVDDDDMDGEEELVHDEDADQLRDARRPQESRWHRFVPLHLPTR
eukprot:Skav234722  [mRNA]  locus=scaffold634:421343:422341:- [translate_table: standard]